MRVYLRTKFEVSSTIITIFREEGDSLPPPPPLKMNPKESTQIRIKN